MHPYGTSLVHFLIRTLPLWLATCNTAMMETRPWPMEASGQQPVAVLQGVTYYLPKAVIPLTMLSSRGMPSAPSAQVTDVTVPSAATTRNITTSPSTTGDKAAAASKPTTLLSVSAENTFDASATDQTAKSPQFTLTASASVPSFVPDYRQKYYLHYTRDDNADAMLSLHTDASGLLSTASGEYVDQTAAEAATLTQIAAAAAKVALDVPTLIETLPTPPGPTKACLLPTINRALNVTPGDNDAQDFDDADRRQLSVASNGDTTLKTVLNGGRGQSATITLQATLLNGATYYSPPVGLVPLTGHSPGVLFRDWQPWKVRITIEPNSLAQDNCNIKKSSAATVAMLPNGGAMFYVDVNREALIDKKVSLAVTNGMLTGVDVSRPSPTLAALKLPLTILQPIISLPFGAMTSNSSHANGIGSSTSQSVSGQ